MAAPHRIRDTSLEAFRQLGASGVLSVARWEVYSATFEHGPHTSGEAFDRLSTHDKRHPLSQSRAVFTWLHDAGLLRVVGKRPCGVSGRACLVWDVTSRSVPLEGANKPRRGNIALGLLQNEVEQLKRENERLHAELLKLTGGEQLRLL